MTSVSTDPCIRETYGQVQALAAGSAKRIRPYVASLLFRDAAGTNSDAPIMPALVALEAFHLFALVHDDIMDDADERYGIRTLHAFIREREQARLGARGADQLGRAHAILAGDALLTLVHDLFVRLAEEQPTLPVTTAHRLLIKVSHEIVTGQHLDIAFTVRPDCAEADIIQRHHLKTALYTFARPMQIGAVLGGGKKDTLVFCEAFGSALGVGFQLEDDLLDLLGDEAETGKTPGIDITQCQHTLLTQHVKERGTPEQKALLTTLWGKHFAAGDLANARTLFTESGAVDALRAKATAAFDEADRLLAQCPLQPATKETLGGLVSFLRQRLP